MEERLRRNHSKHTLPMQKLTHTYLQAQLCHASENIWKQKAQKRENCEKAIIREEIRNH